MNSELGSGGDVTFYPCESCTQPVPAERAFADLETLTVLCPTCLGEKLKPCEECGARIRASAYQHLPTGRVICEPCVLKAGADRSVDKSGPA